MSLEQAIKYIGQALNDYASTMAPSQRDAFAAMAGSAYQTLVSEAQKPAAPAPEADPQV